jgi:nicotinamide riboside transporter PnuC
VLWLITIASLTAVILNIRGSVISFWIWLCTNTAWAIADFHHGLPEQALLQSVYAGLSVWGIVRWSRQAPRRGATAS